MTSLFPRAALVLVSTAIASSACSSKSEAPATAPIADVGASDGASTKDGPAGACPEPEDGRLPGDACVREVHGKVVDSAGKPLEKVIVSVCGFICFYGETRADGTFVTTVNQYIKPSAFSALVHGRPNRTSMYTMLTSPVDNVVTIVNPMKLLDLPASGDAIPVDKGGVGATVTSGDLSLTFPPDNEVTLDIEDFEMKEKGKQFRVAKGNVAELPDFAKGSDVVALYGIAPFDAKSPKKLGVSISNKELKLAPGAAVEFLVLGNELVKDPPTAGTFPVVAAGKVSSDGTKIETDAGEGIVTLTWLGVRPKK